VLHAPRVDRMVLQPINKNHRVPINPAHPLLAAPVIEFAPLLANKMFSSAQLLEYVFRDSSQTKQRVSWNRLAFPHSQNFIRECNRCALS
jgi:hypothetical protein